MTIYCAFCYMSHNGEMGEEQEAITIQGGTATCMDHQGYAHDPNVVNFLILKNHQKEREER